MAKSKEPNRARKSAVVPGTGGKQPRVFQREETPDDDRENSPGTASESEEAEDGRSDSPSNTTSRDHQSRSSTARDGTESAEEEEQDENVNNERAAAPTRKRQPAQKLIARKHMRQTMEITRPKPKQTAYKSTKTSDRTRSSSGDRRSRQGQDMLEKTKKKKQRRHGPLVLREIRRLQMTTNLLIPRLPFQRLVREIARKYAPQDIRFRPDALMAVQEASEFFLTSLFEDVNLAAIHGRRVTAMPRDFTLVLKVRGDPKYTTLEQRGKRRA